MEKKFSFFVITTLFLVIVYVYFLQPAAPPEFVRSLDATAERFERSLVPVPDMQTRHAADTSEVFRPMTMRVVRNIFYLSDFSDFSIYYYDKNGGLQGKLETSRGRGPGEFQNLTDFDVCGETLWTVDIQNLMIHSFSRDTNELIKSVSVEKRPYRIACLKNGFIIQWLGTELLFSKFDNEGNELFQFGEVIEDQMQHMMSLGGNLVSNYDDRFVYIPSYASLIYQFDADGELINVLKAPDGIPFPTTNRVGGSFRAPEYITYRSGWLDNEKNNLYVYARLEGEKQDENGEWTGERQAYIDKYNLITGEYVSSIHFDFDSAPIRAFFTPEAFYSKNTEGEVFIHQFDEEIDF